MKRFLSLLLVSTLVFAFNTKAQTVKKFDPLAAAKVNITANPLSATTITAITTAANYTITTTALTSLPGSDVACPGTTINCSFYALIPSGCGTGITDQAILDGVKNYIVNVNSSKYPTPGVPFNFTVAGSLCTFQGVFFAKN